METSVPLLFPFESPPTMAPHAEAEAKAQLQALEAQFYQQFDVPDMHAKKEAHDTAEESAGEDDLDDDTMDDASNDDDLDDDLDLMERAQAPKQRIPETVVFSDPSKRARDTQSKSTRKQFMSSKIQDLHKEPVEAVSDAPKADSDDDDDQRANDRQLSELLSTTLFAPGTADATKKRKLTTTTNETLARVMELSSADTIGSRAPGTGWAEKKLKAQELGKVPARIRAGLRRAAGERRDRDIETQKELGLWNPKMQKQSRMKRGSETERGSRAMQPKKRQRGIGSGVGKFRGGALHLSEADVRRIRGPHRAT